MGDVNPPKPAPKPGRVKVYRALYNYAPSKEDELTINEGDLLYVSEESRNSDWLKARCGDQVGFVPRDHVMNAEYVEYPLHDAAKRGNIEFLKVCLNNSVSANCLDKSGSTALYWASHGGHTEIVQLLVCLPNTCISAQNKLGDTPLHAAAWKGHLDCIRILLESGAALNIRNNERKKPIDMTTDVNCRALIQLAMREIAKVEMNEYSSSSDDDSTSH